MVRRREDDQGAVALIVALMTLVFCGLLALVVDLGVARDQERLAQNAADAAALAAASSLAHTVNPGAVTPSEIAQAQALASQYVAADGWQPGLAAFTVDPAAGTITVTLAGQHSARFFAGVIGAGTPTVGASAQATWRDVPAPCSMCVLGDFSAQNGQTVNSAGSVLTRRDLNVSPGGTVRSSTGIVGYGGTPNNTGTVAPSPPVHVTNVTDPYAASPQLPPGPPAPPLGSPVVTATTSACTPGTYDDVTACRTFAPGIYVITGQNTFTGAYSVTGTQVLLYFTCSTGSGADAVSAACPAEGAPGGSIAFAGDVTATITPSTDPTYRGLAIVYDRHDTSDLGIVGGPDITISGSVYAASATLVNNGNGLLTVGGTLVVGGVDLHGVPATINVNQSNAVADLPPALVHLTQ
jgi:Flp pilus assembly protein TadG